MSGPKSIKELMLEVENLGNTLATSSGDAVGLQAKFVQRLAELEAQCPELERVEAELDRLVAEAATVAFCATPEQALALVRDFAVLSGPRARLNALGDRVTGAARRIARRADS